MLSLFDCLIWRVLWIILYLNYVDYWFVFGGCFAHHHAFDAFFDFLFDFVKFLEILFFCGVELIWSLAFVDINNEFIDLIFVKLAVVQLLKRWTDTLVVFELTKLIFFLNAALVIVQEIIIEIIVVYIWVTFPFLFDYFTWLFNVALFEYFLI